MNSNDNVAAMLTKPLSVPKRVKFVQMLLQHIFPVREEYGKLEEED